jgi:hypothetical protein
MVQYDSDTGILLRKFTLQLQLMLYVDCTMTKIQNFSFAKNLDFGPTSTITELACFLINGI